VEVSVVLESLGDVRSVRFVFVNLTIPYCTGTVYIRPQNLRLKFTTHSQQFTAMSQPLKPGSYRIKLVFSEIGVDSYATSIERGKPLKVEPLGSPERQVVCTVMLRSRRVIVC
jgi:hypothetical protein